MKLRNKKTGEIIDLKKGHICETVDGESLRLRPFIKDGMSYTYSSLAEFNEHWEDYEEEPYFISEFGKIYPISCLGGDRQRVECLKEIGNYFETEEKAKKAVEKFNAWKRLKDAGFKFVDHIDMDSGQGMSRYVWDGYINGEDLDLLFLG